MFGYLLFELFKISTALVDVNKELEDLYMILNSIRSTILLIG